MSQRLIGKTALVTGAASGIGRAVATRFVAEGATVFFADLNYEAAVVAAKETGSPSARPLSMDVSDESSVETAYATILEDGPLNIVVANAGVQLFGQDARVGGIWTLRFGRRLYGSTSAGGRS